MSAISSKKMKPKTLFSKIFPSYLLITLLGLIGILLIVRFSFSSFYYQETLTSLIQKANLMKSDVISIVSSQNYQKLQNKIVELSSVSNTRITIILPKGKVVADSSSNPAKMENHLNRKEVIEAIDKGIGNATRHSITLKESRIYVAITMLNQQNTKTLGILRISVSTESIDATRKDLTNQILFWSFILVLILTYLIYYQTKKLSTPIELITAQAKLIADGEYRKSTTINIKDAPTREFYELFSVFETMGIKIDSQIEKISKQKNEQLAIFSSMLEGVITITPGLDTFHINKAALSLFNKSQKDVPKGTALQEVVESQVITDLAKELVDTHKTIDQEIEHCDKTLTIHGTILQSEDQESLGAVLVFNNITKMRELENVRKQFVANVSHELKTPLTVIQGYMETIREENIEDKQTLDRFFDIIYKNSTRLKAVIEDLLELSSIERDSEIGGISLETQYLTPVIESVISLCKSAADKKSIIIILESIDIEADINRPLLEQALINLLDNAIKYGPTNSTVKVVLEASNDQVSITVKDSGLGIPEKHHKRLFERFYSVDKARSRELGGSGLGLAIVKHIVITHNGNIRVESAVGQGSSFIIEFPIIKS